MFMVRTVMKCKPGKVNELVGKFKALGGVMKDMGLAPFRLYTDVAGEQFWTLVAEREYERLEEIQQLQTETFADKRAQEAMGGYHDLVVSGHREIYKVEA